MIFLGSPIFDLPLCPPHASDSDIREVVWVMNSCKEVDEEGFKAKFCKHMLLSLSSHLDDLFNHVVFTGFPSEFSHHIILLIQKSCPSLDPNNYMMIMVGYASGMILRMENYFKM
jgi:hypothetical protein